MELADVLIFVLYVMFAIAIAGIIWSTWRRNRHGAGRQAVQNGVRVRIINFTVWTLLLVIVIIAGLAGDGSVADTMIITLATLGLLLLATVAWSLLRKK